MTGWTGAAANLRGLDGPVFEAISAAVAAIDILSPRLQVAQRNDGPQCCCPTPPPMDRLPVELLSKIIDCKCPLERVLLSPYAFPAQ